MEICEFNGCRHTALHNSQYCKHHTFNHTAQVGGVVETQVSREPLVMPKAHKLPIFTHKICHEVLIPRDEFKRIIFQALAAEGIKIAAHAQIEVAPDTAITGNHAKVIWTE